MFLLKYFAVGKDEHHHHDDEDDEAVRLVRAQETLDALSSVVGIMPPTAVATTTLKHQQPLQQGEEAWSTQLVDAKKKELLAEPAIECPPYSDPSSVLILDQGSLEFELEPSSSSLTTTNAADAAATATADVSADSSNCSLLLSSSSDVTDYDDDETSTTEEASTATSTTKSTTTIRFASMVSVAEIPSHRDMDSEDVERIWTSTREVNQNGRRNVTEWNWDQRDWKNATEEDQMIYDATTNEYIHPATWEEIEADRLQEQQEMERMNRALAAAAAAQAEAEAEDNHQYQYQQPHDKMATPQEQEQELDRMHLALEEAVRREWIRKEANRRLQQNYQRSRHHHRTSSSSSTTTSSSSRASTSPRSRANLARKRMMRSPQVHGVKHPYYSMAGTVGGGSLTRFADT